MPPCYSKCALVKYFQDQLVKTGHLFTKTAWTSRDSVGKLANSCTCVYLIFSFSHSVPNQYHWNGLQFVRFLEKMWTLKTKLNSRSRKTVVLPGNINYGTNPLSNWQPKQGTSSIISYLSVFLFVSFMFIRLLVGPLGIIVLLIVYWLRDRVLLILSQLFLLCLFLFTSNSNTNFFSLACFNRAQRINFCVALLLSLTSQPTR